MQKTIDDASELCLRVAKPRHVLRLCDYDGEELHPVGFKPLGSDIANHLRGCRKVYLFAATLGSDIERTESGLAARSAATALIFDAAASCAIESYADDVCEELAASTDLPLTPRFSCGYGDFPLTSQWEICRALDTQRRIGLFTDDSGLLMPRKSITALIGVGATNGQFGTCRSKCAMCKNVNCVFRKID